MSIGDGLLSNCVVPQLLPAKEVYDSIKNSYNCGIKTVLLVFSIMRVSILLAFIASLNNSVLVSDANCVGM